MNTIKEDFFKAINEKRIVEVTFLSSDKGFITRECVPLDFGPSRRTKDQTDRYHFYDLNSPDGEHILSILPDQIKSLILTDQNFDPSKIVTWQPNWFVKRDWGSYS